jgi:glycosyltransferase involved in cell wall biosynthesis
MKTLSIIISNLEIGGAEKNAVIIANAFSELGYHVEVLLLQARGPLFKNLHSNISVIDLKCKQKWMVFFKLLNYFFRNKRDAILAFMFPITFWTMLASKIASPHTRIVLTERTTYSQQFFEKGNLTGFHQFLTKRLMKLVYPIADRVILVSKQALFELKKFLDDGYQSKINYQVIYNPLVLFDGFNPEGGDLIEQWGKDNAHKLLSVGRLRQEKNYPCLLQAFAKLAATENVRLLILGDGPERLYLENLIQQYSLQDRVLMPGFMNNTNVFYKAADLYVMSSWVEGFPNVLLEAMYHGLNIVSTDCASGPREILEDGKYGTLVAVDQVDELYHAMKMKLYEKHDPFLLESRARTFSIETTIAQYMDALFGPKAIIRDKECVE